MQSVNINTSLENRIFPMTNSSSLDSFLSDTETSISLPQWLFIPFIIISIVESILGTVGNILVIIAISCLGKSNPHHRSYNSFIVNLALSDLVLCLFTMPLNTYRSLNTYMKFPPAFCKLADTFPAINICVSSLTIVAISIHRYLVVCFPHKQLMGTFMTFLTMIGIWFLAIVAASPLFIYSSSLRAYDDELIERTIDLFCANLSDDSCMNEFNQRNRRLHVVCYESWPQYGNLRLVYTIFIFFLQFILPIFIISVTYYQVMLKLRERFRYRFLIKRHNISSLRQEVSRQRRNNVLLLLIVSSYAISWLPFNISYTIFTYKNRYLPNSEGNPTHSKMQMNDLLKYLPLRFLICMISAITNPFVYGYFNETFKDGLERIVSLFCPRFNRNINVIYYKQTDISSFPTNESKVRIKTNDLSAIHSF
ncbi:unnamed protein product [Adineta ricciae]|uniref:G-protein coupled receptors family 1 profile domain-containing protein n=1 Tax=Adineta ricciae TaxID=249248 RepID=A0A814NKC0_ADIRI|nr:unnamed protein product [Adineta ricciae]